MEQEPEGVPALRLDPSVVHDPRGGRRVPVVVVVVGPPVVVLPIVVALAGVEEEAEVDPDLQAGGARVGREEHGEEEEVMRLRLFRLYTMRNEFKRKSITCDKCARFFLPKIARSATFCYCYTLACIAFVSGMLLERGRARDC